jgi:hypothetical protein
LAETSAIATGSSKAATLQRMTGAGATYHSTLLCFANPFGPMRPPDRSMSAQSAHQKLFGVFGSVHGSRSHGARENADHDLHRVGRAGECSGVIAAAIARGSR